MQEGQSFSPGEGKETGNPEPLEGKDMTRPEPATPDEIKKAQDEFPKEGEVLSHASTIPSLAGDSMYVQGDFGIKAKESVPVIKLETERPDASASRKDNRVLEGATRELDDGFSQEHRDALLNLMVQMQTGNTSLVGQCTKMVASHREAIRGSQNPAAQMRAELVGYLGEQLALMYPLKDGPAKTVSGATVLDNLPKNAEVVSTYELFRGGKAFLGKLLLSLEEAGGDLATKEWRERGYVSLFSDAERQAGYPNIGKAIEFDAETGKYVANNEVVRPAHPAVVEVLRHINDDLTSPDGLILDSGDYHLLVDGAVEVKFYTPEEIHEMVSLTGNNPNRGELGGTAADGKHLVVGLTRERLYVEALSSPAAVASYRALVVRFPEGTAKEDILALAELAKERGHEEVIFQTVPFTRKEADVVAEKMIEVGGLDKLVSSSQKLNK